MAVLKQALRTALAQSPSAATPAAQRRLLNLACGRADETAVLAEVFGAGTSDLEIVGADIRGPEIEEAARRWRTPAGTGIQTRFHREDGRRFLQTMSSHDRFDLAFLRHQNFWNDPDLWGRMFDGALQRLNDGGLVVITSYFDQEHELACQKLASLGAEMIAEHRNPLSRALTDAPGKSVDRHIAIFRRHPPS
jgi:SAM-dependent methyltransferase